MTATTSLDPTGQRELLNRINSRIVDRNALISRTDTKAQIVLAAAALLLGVGLRGRPEGPLDLITTSTAVVLLAAALAAALLASFPRLGGGAGPTAIGRDATVDPKTLLDEHVSAQRAEDVEQQLLDAATEYARLTRLAISKFRFLQIAFTAALGSLPPLVFAIIL